MRCRSIWLAVLMAASPLGAQPAEKNPPEALLPAACLAFARYDGYEPHKKAYDQTALGKVMNDDLGEAIDYCSKLVDTWLGTSFPVWEKNRELFHKSLEGLWKHGIVVGVEFADSESAQWRVTLVLPQGINRPYRDIVPQAFKTLEGTEVDPIEFTERKIHSRTVHEAKRKKLTIAWWYESPHAVVTIGTLPPEDVIAVADGKAPNLMSTRNHRRVADFKGYETDIRGFADLEKIVGVWRRSWGVKEKPPGGSVIGPLILGAIGYRLGLSGLDAMTVHLGFDGKFQRSTVKVYVVEPEKRVGILKLPGAGLAWTGKLDGLPIPPDAATVAVRHIAWEPVVKEVTDFVVLVEGLMALGNLTEKGWRWFLPDLGPPADKDPADLVIVDTKQRDALRNAFHVFVKDAVPALDTTYLSYDAPSEGLFALGSVWAIKLKDAKRFEQALERLHANLQGPLRESGLKIDKKRYRGTELVVLSKLGIPFAPTYAIHDGWCVISLVPQPVKGFIWRSEPERRRWTQPEYLADLYARARAQGPASAKLGSVHIEDPRPWISFGLSILPLFANSVGVVLEFDATKLPHAQAVTEPLFPNVTFFFDDGNVLRWECYFSVEVWWTSPLLLQLGGMPFGPFSDRLSSADVELPGSPRSESG